MQGSLLPILKLTFIFNIMGPLPRWFPAAPRTSMFRKSKLPAVACFALFALHGCATKNGDSTANRADSGQTDDPVCVEPKDITCEDALILQLGLQDDESSSGSVETTMDGEDFITTVDATAGGINDAPTSPWVYFRFTPDGAQKVDIPDTEALARMDWDISLRRFIIRLNGGSSGPSCVGAITLLEDSYEGVTAVPSGAAWVEDDYYTDDCTLVNDTSGLPDSPQVALGAWWSYSGCVATTMAPHLIRLASGDVVKMVVESYYASGQDGCNETGNRGTGSANITLRWSYL